LLWKKQEDTIHLTETFYNDNDSFETRAATFLYDRLHPLMFMLLDKELASALDDPFPLIHIIKWQLPQNLQGISDYYTAQKIIYKTLLNIQDALQKDKIEQGTLDKSVSFVTKVALDLNVDIDYLTTLQEKPTFQWVQARADFYTSLQLYFQQLAAQNLTEFKQKIDDLVEEKKYICTCLEYEAKYDMMEWGSST